ncbi:MAG: ABC transporter ATP-binding protein [Pseudomonadota bacterium]
MAEVRVDRVTKRFGTFTALDSVTMDFPDGGFFALLGPSGSGKTTLLRAIAGFIFLDQGSIRIGRDSVETVPVEKREIGMMFQNYALFPNMTVGDNIGFGLRVRKVGAAEERRRVGEALELVQLSEFSNRKPHQLSGGQRQRVALARAIVTNPRVLLLDEPLSALDKALRVDMQTELKRIQREVGITTIFVTHDQEEALTLADKIGILRTGRMVQSGSPREVYKNPIDLFTAEFLGEANILQHDNLARSPGSKINVPNSAGDMSALAVRAENTTVSTLEPMMDGVSKMRGVLTRRVFAGAMGTCVVDVAGLEIKVIGRDAEIPDLETGVEVWVSWKNEDMFVVPDAAKRRS